MAHVRAPGFVARSAGGNTIVLVLAILLGVGVAILLFALSYVRFLGTNQEQRTAIESAALAAARELSRVVIEDPNFGFVSISDYAPAAPNTKAGDGQAMPVTGINTLLATIRVDMLVANQVGDSTMKTMADRDYAAAMNTKDFLVSVLKQAVLPGTGGTTFRDVDGNPVHPYQAAVEAYESNQVRMAGGKSRLINNSMKLSVGCLKTPNVTSTPIPKPAGLAQVSSSQANQGCYLSYVNIPAAGRDFVFAAINRELKLVNNGLWASTISGLPYFIPTVVKAEADHLITSGTDPQGKVVHAIACAQSASVNDPRPAPGAFTISFPNGSVPEMVKLLDLMSNPLIASSSATIKSSAGGDTPGGGALGPATVPPWGGTMPTGQAVSLSWYDWLRRAGVKADIQAAQNMLAAPFGAGITATTGGVNVYTFNDDGTIRYAQVVNPGPRTVVVSENQGYAEALGAFTSPGNGNKYDIVGTDNVHTPGRMRGGRHGGEPLDDAVVTASQALPSQTIASNGAGGITAAALLSMLLISIVCGAAGARSGRVAIKSPPLMMTLFLACLPLFSMVALSACSGGPAPPPKVVTSSVVGPRVVRPTYTKNGLAVDITVRKSN